MTTNQTQLQTESNSQISGKISQPFRSLQSQFTLQIVQQHENQINPLNDFIAGQVTETTRKAYRTNVKQFFQFLGIDEITPVEVQKVTVQHVIAYRNNLIESESAHTTINRKLSAIRSFFDFLVALRVIENSPADPKLVRGLKVSRTSSTNSLTVDQIRAILKVIDNLNNPVMKLRDRALILLLVYGGLRRSEAANVKREDIQMKESHWILRIPEAKGGSNQMIKLQPVVVEAINSYLDYLSTIRGIIDPTLTPIFIGLGYHQHDQIIPLTPAAINRIVKRHAKRAGVTESISAHLCRHSTASLAIASGAQPHKVQAHLRHRSITTTMRYVHDREALESNASDFIRI